jgi:hypothetical protein
VICASLLFPVTSSAVTKLLNDGDRDIGLKAPFRLNAPEMLEVK